MDCAASLLTPGAEGAHREQTRQVHLDFHASEHISRIGSRFSKEQFQEVLKLGRVNLVNVFANGHHGWSYYPTQVGHVHPGLGFDLLGAQLEACHEIGVACPIYFTIGWSDNDAWRHPEWTRRARDGSFATRNDYDFSAAPDAPKPLRQWMNMCLNTGYHDHVMAQVEEISRRYDVDGFWFDIYQAGAPCWCETCTKAMREQGVDLDDAAAVADFAIGVIKDHQREVVELVRSHHPEVSCSVSRPRSGPPRWRRPCTRRQRPARRSRGCGLPPRRPSGSRAPAPRSWRAPARSPRGPSTSSCRPSVSR